MNNSTAVFPEAPNLAVPKASDFHWRLYAFEITRRPSSTSLDAKVCARRVLVYAPYVGAAVAGCGVAKDESCHATVTRLLERFENRQPQREDIADFYEIVGSALSTGAAMALALNMAARTARSPRMRGIIGVLHDRVMHGEELHAAMRRFPRQFAPMQIAMVEAAAATGLDKAGGLLVTLARRLQRDGKVWRTLVGALAYPASLLFLTGVGAVVLDLWALPPMVELFRTLGGRLPPLTRGFYAVAQVLRAHAAVVLPIAALLVGAAAAYAPAFVRTRFAQRAALRLWVIGPILQALALIRALSTFLLLKQSGARVKDQFAMAAAASGNCVVAEFFHACYARIARGESVEEAFTAERHRLGNDGIRIAGKMEIGMAGAELSGLLGRVVEELDDRAEARLRLLPELVRWPLLLTCCVLIGTVALAIVLPYPNLIADVAHQQAGH